MVPRTALKESINKASYAYKEKHIGPKEEGGNKGGFLSKWWRVVLNAEPAPPACATEPRVTAGGLRLVETLTGPFFGRIDPIIF